MLLHIQTLHIFQILEDKNRVDVKARDQLNRERRNLRKKLEELTDGQYRLRFERSISESSGGSSTSALSSTSFACSSETSESGMCLYFASLLYDQMCPLSSIVQKMFVILLGNSLILLYRCSVFPALLTILACSFLFASPAATATQWLVWKSQDGLYMPLYDVIDLFMLRVGFRQGDTVINNVSSFD